MHARLPAAVLTLLLAAPVLFGAAADRDGDGILDEHEEVLGTDPAQPETLRIVIEDGPESEQRRKQKTYDPTKDVLTVAFGHVAEDRYLWRVTLAAPPRLDDTVLHLYVDADANPETGRTGPKGGSYTGTDYMISVVGGRAYCGHYDADGVRTNGPPVSVAVHGNAVLVSIDAPIGRDEKGVRCSLYVLCHTTTKAGGPTTMSDSTGRHPIAGIPVTGRRKIVRPCDHTENFQVAAACGIRMLRAILRDERTVVVRHDQLELDGFEIDTLTSHRWPHLKLLRRNARASAQAPKAGRYHVGLMMYDDQGHTDRVSIHVDGTLRGVAVANQDNNRTWLYWLTDPLDLKGGERVELRGVGGGGAHGIINLLFLPQPPEPTTLRCAVANMAAVPSVDVPGRVTVSWTTTWPCATRFEHGTDKTYGTTAGAEGRCLVHRVVLDGLKPNVEYHGRAIGAHPDGSPAVGADLTFRARPPEPPPTREGTQTVPLTVRNPHPFAVEDWPVTTGIPFPRGELASPDHVRLLGQRGEEPAQVKLTARWPDGSVKWLLVTFFADAPAGGAATYRLEYGRAVRRAPIDQGIVLEEYPPKRNQPEGTYVRTGALGVFVHPWGEFAFWSLSGKALVGFCENTITDIVGTDGEHYCPTQAKAEIIVEEAGPLRTVLKMTYTLKEEKGAGRFRIEKRLEAYRNAPYVRVHHTFTVTSPQTFTEIKELTFRVPVLAGESSELLVPLADGQELRLSGKRDRVRQRFDRELAAYVHPQGKPTPGVSRKARIVGSFLDERGGAVALRGFWRNYPTSFAKTMTGGRFGLCSPLEPGLYDKFPFEKEGHHLYYHLRNGVHRLKQGMSKTHEIFVCFEPREKSRQLCALFQQPLLATAPPEWYCKSGAFYDVHPRDVERFPLYEQAIDRNLKAYADRRERQHDFGMMNYGDWYGERGSNWGNVEYDTQHAFFLEYIRSGNPDAFFLGCATELHNRDIDTVHWSPDGKSVGAVYVHQMCHVGGYYTKSVPGTLGFPRAGFTVSHAWTEGHFDHYFLTGDRRSYETGCAVADFFIGKQLGRPYDFLTTRVPGWHLIMLAAAYHATGDPYYLNAARVVVDRVLETQDVEPRPLPAHQAKGRKPFQVGGWSRMMRPGHCRCEPRHRGNAGFMVAILLSGLKYYHDVTGDERVKEAIIRGAHYLLDECYSDEVKGFRYTSCPKTGYRPGATPLMVEGIARAYVWTKDERLRRCLAESLPLGAGGSGYGKGFSMYYRMAPRVLADLAKAGIRLEGKK